MPETESNIAKLGNGVGVAAIGDVAVVLDVTQNRYSLWRGTCAAALVQLASKSPCSVPEPELQRLQAHGLVAERVETPGPWLSPTEVAEPTVSLLEGPEQGQLDFLPAMESIWACMQVRIELQQRTLHGILASLPRLQRGRSVQDLAGHARAFDRARRFAPVRPRCLPDALAYVRKARRRGHPADLVFGVKLQPFEAHCWAQCGNLVLTDPLERVRRFQVVLAV